MTTAMADDEFEDPSEYRVANGALNPHLNPRSTHQGKGRGKDDDDNPTRAKDVVALRLAGASYEEIAEILSYASARRVRDVFERALAETVDETTDLPRLRHIQQKRLERMLSSTWERANDPTDPDHLAYSARALALIDRQIKLLGLDAPQQIHVTRTPDYEEVKGWIEGMARRMGGERPQEADILGLPGEIVVSEEEQEQWPDETPA